LVRYAERYFERGELPDIDIVINIMDEPRSVIEWDTMKAYVEKERAERKIVPVGQVIENFSSNLSFGIARKSNIV
jgi:hypothetical protein